MSSDNYPHLLTPPRSPKPTHIDMSVTEPPQLPFYRLVFLTCAMAGVQICYAAQINQGTPQLLLLGLPSRLVSLAWLAGPLSGLIVQPIVGRLSDSCLSPYGRRRPFLLGGAILTSLSLILFANAHLLPSKVTVAVFAFFCLDFAIQAVQGPLRALVTDVVPKNQRAMANSCLAFFTGVGLLAGGLLTSVRLSAVFPFATDVQALFAIAAIILLLTVGLCVTMTDEVEWGGYRSIGDDHVDGEDQQEERAFGEALKSVPRPYWQVFSVQLCTWVGFFTLFVYVNAWVGTNVFLGDGSAEFGSEARETFEKGVRLAGSANAAMAMLTIAYSIFLPILLNRFGVRAVYMFSQLVEAMSLMAAPFIRGSGEQIGIWLKAVVFVDIGIFGVVWATTMGVPWTLIGDALQSDEWYRKRVGLFQTTFNASQSGPQLVVAALVAPLVLWLSNDDPSWVMFVGGVFALVGAALVQILRVDVFEEGGVMVERKVEMFQIHDGMSGEELNEF
eukprot:GFKZ01004673.1.p1 GENE.GFKZ01004673.1~~GFKZ01004673.1.p1  ORF type:complete len:502 (-),score=73.94 GFKZ01004673.1:446-1951(-)